MRFALNRSAGAVAYLYGRRHPRATHGSLIVYIETGIVGNPFAPIKVLDPKLTKEIGHGPHR